MSASRSSGTSTLTPSAASTSAPPVRDDSARLPCFATGTSQPATTKVTAVEMLRVPAASPPVPQTSIASSGAATAVIRARMARTAPVISGTVSPRTRIAISKAPICAGVASPDMMMSNAPSASVSLRVSPAARRARNGFRLLDTSRSGGARRGVGAARDRQEICQQFMAMLAGDAFGMKLYAEYRQRAVPHAHDQPVLGPRCRHQLLGQCGAVNDQAVVARGAERGGQSFQDVGGGVKNSGHLAMHRHRRAHHLPAECLAN